MKIVMFYESGEIPEIGTGHKYRSKEIAKILRNNGHEVEFMLDGVLIKERDVLIIDHISSQKSLINRAKHAGMKVVLIDGVEEDVTLVDLSISSFINAKSQYTGAKYIAFPTQTQYWERYRPSTSSNTVFVGMGGYDHKNLADLVLNILDDMGLNAIVAKSINHNNFKDKFSRVEIFEENNYYDAMRECVIAITNGGLTLFQSLYYGIPTIPLPQYEHQKKNIEYVSHCCVPSKLDADDIKQKINWLIDNEYYRQSVSTLARHFVDGKGSKRICSLIEKIK